jgi:hypothetical protein
LTLFSCVVAKHDLEDVTVAAIPIPLRTLVEVRHPLSSNNDGETPLAIIHMHQD